MYQSYNSSGSTGAGIMRFPYRFSEYKKPLEKLEVMPIEEPIQQGNNGNQERTC
jgi:hypothetical protein